MKDNMRIKIVLSMITMLVMTSITQAVEIEVGEDSININGQLQLHGSLEGVDDPYSNSERLFLFLRQARLSVNGDVNNVEYEVEWMLGGEEVPENNSVMSLLDAYINIPIQDDAFGVKLGQFKVPYGRERLLDSGNAYNVNRSIGNNFFNIGRDVGVALHKEDGLFSGALGMFTGGGINIPERYIPEDIGVPMFITRIGINNGLDEDVFTPAGYDGPKDREGFAAYLNLMYNKDSRVGHSTPLNVKYFDKSLILNSDWNPYVAARGEKSEFYQIGADAAWQTALTEESSLLLSAEAHLSSFDNNKGGIENSGGTIAANVIKDNCSFGVRYAVVDPDAKMAYTETGEENGADVKKVFPVTSDLIHEIAPSFVYSLKDYNVKLIAELSYQMDVPVSVEKGNGVYNLMRQPDQVSYASNEGIELQDNYLASLVVQFNF
jgi:hypothetical protein